MNRALLLLVIGALASGCHANDRNDCFAPALSVYWRPSAVQPQAGFQVPGLVAAGLPPQLDCGSAGVVGVRVYVGARLDLVPCTGAGACLDGSTWRCDFSEGGIRVPLQVGGTYDVQVDAVDAAGSPKYSGLQAASVSSCGDTSIGAFPQGLPGTLGLIHTFAPFASCATGSSIEWTLTRDGLLVEDSAAPCFGPIPLPLAGSASLPAGIYQLDRVAEATATTTLHALCGATFLHAGADILAVTLPAPAATCN
jgi:hypothetical protein